MFSTCKTCTKRYSGCHSECEIYERDKAAHDAKQANIRKQKASYNLYREYKSARMTKVLYH